MTIKDIVAPIEAFAPPALQENYDNAGLIVGNYSDQVSGALLCIDVTEAVIDEAIEKNADLIISHHPIVFKGLKRFNGSNYVERTVIKALQNKIAIYAAHTNIDNVPAGVNGRICDKLGLINRRILSPQHEGLVKLVSFVPEQFTESVSKAIFEAGAGTIGQYDSCSFQSSGKGTFRAQETASPFVGEIGKHHSENETKLEIITPKHQLSRAINALRRSHPYEEVAYDVIPLSNSNPQIGAGMIGSLPEALPAEAFLGQLKRTFGCKCIRHTDLCKESIKTVAVCGGSGSFLLRKAVAAKADIFVTGDFKYHEFFDAEDKIIIADIGHYESEQFTKDIFYDILNEKLFNFALYKSTANTNPIKYY